MNDSPERDAVYSWARRHSLHDPYSFAIFNEEHWGDKERLAERARVWERDHLLDRKGQLEDEVEDLRRRIGIVDNDLKRVEDCDYA